MQNELIEQVARAICKASWKYKGIWRDKHDDLLESYWVNHIDEAKAGIAAMATGKGPIPQYFDGENLELAVAEEYLNLPKDIAWESATERLINSVNSYIA